MTMMKDATVDVLVDVLPRVPDLRRTAGGYGLEATKAESALLSPAETYIRTVLQGMDDPAMTLIAGNIRNFWTKVLAAYPDD